MDENTEIIESKEFDEVVQNGGNPYSADVEKLNHDIYHKIVLNEYIYLQPFHLNNKIDDIIAKKLRDKIEGRCIKMGYVLPSSTKILSRSLGVMNNANFNGITTYKVNYSAEVCNPAVGQIIECLVGYIDKSEVICYIDSQEKSPVEIYLYKHHHVGNVEFSLLKKDDIVKIKVAGTKFNYRDTQIIAIAQFLNKV